MECHAERFLVSGHVRTILLQALTLCRSLSFRLCFSLSILTCMSLQDVQGLGRHHCPTFSYPFVPPSSRALGPACFSSCRGALVPLSRSVLARVPVRTSIGTVIHDWRDHSQRTFRRFPLASLTVSDVLIHTHPTSFDCPDRVPTSQGTFATGSQAAAIFSENNSSKKRKWQEAHW